MDNPSPKLAEFPVSFFLKRGTLFGAGLGMLGGLIDLSFAEGKPTAEVASIFYWRNCILIGAACGLILGGIIAWWFRSPTPAEDGPSAENP